MSEPTVTATAADNKPRTVKPDKPPVVDPEAPYGWMPDPKAPGGKRPKKRPGKQAKTVTPPRSRPANAARQTKAPATADFTKPVMELLDGLWTLGAGLPVPEPGFKVAGVGLYNPSIRLKAQMAILKDNGAGVVNGVAIMAKHSEPVRNFITRAGDESGPAWVIPAIMALLPFAVQSASMWKAPVAGEVEKLAKRTEAEFDELVKGAMAQAQAEAEFMAASAAQAEAYDAAHQESPNGTSPGTG
jgi:hypothetical protein